LILIDVDFFKSLGLIKAQITARLGSSLTAVLETSHNALRIWITATKTDVSVLAQSPGLCSAVEAQLGAQSQHDELATTGALEQIRHLLSGPLREYGFMDFAVIAPDGTQIAASRPQEVGQNDLMRGDSATISSALAGRAAVGLPFLRQPGGPTAVKAAMLAAAPVYDRSGAIIAAFLFMLDPSRDFTEITRLGRFGHTGETYACDRRALLLTNSRFETEPSVGAGDAILSRQIRVPGNRPVTRPLTRMAESAIAGNSSFDTVGYRDYRGIPVIGTWLWDRDLGLGLATEMDLAEAYGFWYIIRRLTIIMLLAIGGAVAAMFIILISRARIKACSFAQEQARKRPAGSACSSFPRITKPSQCYRAGLGSFDEIDAGFFGRFSRGGFQEPY
jgi:hypothetical protein